MAKKKPSSVAKTTDTVTKSTRTLNSDGSREQNTITIDLTGVTMKKGTKAVKGFEVTLSAKNPDDTNTYKLKDRNDPNSALSTSITVPINMSGNYVSIQFNAEEPNSLPGVLGAGKLTVTLTPKT